MKEFEGYRVLLAEDDEIAREIVANIVEDLGATCVTARDGEELLAILNGREGDAIDLVLTGDASGTFTLAVEDTGCGIGEADLKRLATPFVQVGAQKAKAGGTGLGL